MVRVAYFHKYFYSREGFFDNDEMNNIIKINKLSCDLLKLQYRKYEKY